LVLYIVRALRGLGPRDWRGSLKSKVDLSGRMKSQMMTSKVNLPVSFAYHEAVHAIAYLKLGFGP
jgi:hypothetical protein